jgi:hypothetical protein
MDGPERFVLRPLAEILMPGNSLTPAEVAEIQEGLSRRDTLISDYRERLAALQQRLDAASAYYQEVLKTLRVPLLGYGAQEGATRGMYPDAWVAPSFGVRVLPWRPAIGVALHGWAPKNTPPDAVLILTVNGVRETFALRPGVFVERVDLAAPSMTGLEIGVEATAVEETGGDRRPRAFVLQGVEVRHDNSQSS